MEIIQVFAVITGLISVFFTMKQNILCWPFGIVSCVLLGVFFNDYGMFGQLTLQVVSLGQCIWGWVRWNKVDTKEVGEMGILPIGLLVIFGIVAGNLFTRLTVPHISDYWITLDGCGACLALIATYLLIIKDIHVWLFFMVNNMIVVILSLHLHTMYPIAVLNGILFIVSIFGYIEWKKNLKTV